MYNLRDLKVMGCDESLLFKKKLNTIIVNQGTNFVRNNIISIKSEVSKNANDTKIGRQTISDEDTCKLE